MASNSRPQFPPEVLAALKQGNKMEAIKLLRERTNLGVTEAKALVDMLDKAKGVIGTAQAIASAVQPAKAAVAKAAAARSVARPAGPVKMRPAASPHLARRPGLSPGEEPRDGSGAWGIVVLIAVGLAVAFSFVR